MPRRHQRPQPHSGGRTTLTPDDIEAVSEATMMKILEAPDGVQLQLVQPDGKRFIALLAGVPRPGDHLWMSVRRNSKPKRWKVERVEWFVQWPLRDVEVHLSEDPVQPARPQ